jgi:FtsH-binding integral membrane protein
MNTNLLNAVKRVVSEQGEAILANPARLKGFISDYAKNEPAGDRLAFGRCIEGGYYAQFKNTRTDAERRRLKAALLTHLQAASGQDAATCQNTLDLLEAVLFNIPVTQYNTPASSVMPQSASPTMQEHGAANPVSKKTLLFGIAAGAGALIGDLVSEFFRDAYASTMWQLIISIAIWGSFVGFGISLGLLIAQTFSTKKKPGSEQLIKTVLIGIIVGALSGGFAQFIFYYTQQVSYAVKQITNALCWGIMGAGLGLGAAFYVPNYPPKRAALSGAIGGTIGGAIYVALMGFSLLGSLIGIVVLGLAIGLTISYIEEALREAWLTIIWGRNETTTVSLGLNPVSFGSSREADVFLPRRPSEPNAPPIRAIFMIENGKVVIDNHLTGTRQQLPHGSQVDLGGVSVMVNVKTGK